MTTQKRKIHAALNGRTDMRVQLIFSFIVSLLIFIFYRKVITSVISLFVTFIIIQLFFYFKARLDESEKIHKMEDIFPDFIELMASNLRAGMTIDKALLMSSKKEFSPLDQEILSLGKDILTGKEITLALTNMAMRIKSDKIKKTVDLINSGIKSGGNLSILLEETAVAMRERLFIEKKAASNVLMYVIFIFFATAIGAPILFALSTVLVEIMSKLLANASLSSADNISSNMPFSLSKINVSVAFVTYFSIIFLIISNILSSLMLGITNKGEEKEGLKYLIPMLILSIITFFAVRLFMLKYLVNMVG